MEYSDSHILLLYLLKKFNQICSEGGIPYYASGGTLLGAVRHGGFIPWDDDIDVMIPRGYYEKFVEASERVLSSPVVIRTRENDKSFCCEYIKLCFCDDNDIFSELSLDVFFLDETDKEKKLFRFCQNGMLTLLYKAKMMKAARDGGRRYMPKNPLSRAVSFAASLLPYGTIDKIHKSTMTAEKKTCPDYVNWGSCYNYNKATYSKKALGIPQAHRFENTEIFTAEHPQIILTQLYGESYMTPPPPEKRFNHSARLPVCAELDIEKIRREVGGERK